MRMKTTSYVLSALVAGFAIAGCGKSGDTQQAVSTPGATRNGPPGAPGSPSGGGNIAPMTTAPVGIAPIAGSENLQGGGSGVGQAMKDRAKRTASGPSSSLDQQPPEEENGSTGN